MTAVAAGPMDLSGDRRRLRKERRVRRTFLAAGVSSLVISVAIVVSLFGKALAFFSNVSLDTLWTMDRWAPRIGKFDLATLFAGSVLVTAVAMVIATPLGLAAAIYLAEYAKPRVRR